MAAADYHLCDVCGNKTFYDADLDGFSDKASGAWLYGTESYRGFRAYALCGECEQTHKIVIRPKEPTP